MVGRFLRWLPRFLPPSIHVIYHTLPLRVGRTCENDGLSLLCLHYIAKLMDEFHPWLHHTRLQLCGSGYSNDSSSKSRLWKTCPTGFGGKNAMLEEGHVIRMWSQPLGCKRKPWPTSGKKVGTLVYQLQGTEFYQQPKWDWKITLSLRWNCSSLYLIIWWDPKQRISHAQTPDSQKLR